MAALEKTQKPLTREQQLVVARTEFLDLQRRFDLTIADVVAFFPEEEGIGYLQQLIEASSAKPPRKR
ncbi:2-hydroxyacyl-CoA dehydratase [Dyella sp. A6]|uniref:2-hydroxyacyl-CoA dehydratase n=1 Tax=Dyella aluminiiresistens TaxID=3069105 RepID=UPI002E771B70|nr:2-hydroxyacyl-CoA dehydratase [Dyella sp. A6]